MKNKKAVSILTSFVATLFILSLFSGIAVAQKQGENNGNYANTEKQFGDAKAQLDKAFKQFNAKKDSKSKENLVVKAQNYLEKAIDHTNSYLNRLKSTAEKSENIGIIPFNVPNIIGAHVAELEQLKTKVQQDNTTEELRADNNELKDIYTTIRLETRYDFAMLLSNRIDKFIAKADNVTAKLNAAILNLKGKDTSNLEAIEANFTSLMQQAAADQNATKALLATHNGFNDSGMVTNITDAQAFLNQVDVSQRETINVLRDAARQLQVFVRDYRRLSGGLAVTGQPESRENERGIKTLASGNNTLVANGSGRAVIEGNVTVTLSGINGTLVVSNNTAVTTDGTNQTLGNGQVKYQGFTFATITPLTAGGNIRVAISGNNINLTATCDPTATTCTAFLNGRGTFSVSGIGNLSVSGGWKKGD